MPHLQIIHIHKERRELVEYRPKTCFSAMEFTVVQSQSSNMILDTLDLEHGYSPLLFNSIRKFIKVKIISAKKGTHWMRF